MKAVANSELHAIIFYLTCNFGAISPYVFVILETLWLIALCSVGNVFIVCHKYNLKGALELMLCTYPMLQ